MLNAVCSVSSSVKVVHFLCLQGSFFLLAEAFPCCSSSVFLWATSYKLLCGIFSDGSASLNGHPAPRLNNTWLGFCPVPNCSNLSYSRHGRGKGKGEELRCT